VPTTLAPTLDALRALMPELRRRFGVRAISVFGSRARGDATPDSDLDLLVDFEPDARPTLFSLAAIDQTIEGALGLKAHTVPRSSLNPRYAPYIEPDLVPV
jgi:predicted nucleotidyltransferase